MMVMRVSEQRSLAGEAPSSLVLNFKASHIRLLARAHVPGGCDFFSYCSALLFQVST